MSEPAIRVMTPQEQERLAVATKKQTDREAGIRAQAIQEGRKLERSDLQRALGSKALDEAIREPTLAKAHASELERLRHEWMDNAKHAGRANLMTGAIVGLLVGAIGAAAGVSVFVMQSQATLAVNVRAMNEQPYQPPVPLTIRDAPPHPPACDMALVLPGHHCPIQPASAPN